MPKTISAIAANQSVQPSSRNTALKVVVTSASPKLT